MKKKLIIGYAIVGAVTGAIRCLLMFKHISKENGKGISTVLGMFIGVLINLVVWPIVVIKDVVYTIKNRASK